MPLDVSEQRGHTHVIPLGFWGATLSIRWVPAERSLGMTDCTLTSQGVEERYSLFMKSKMENPFTRADSWPEKKKKEEACFSFQSESMMKLRCMYGNVEALTSAGGNKICHNSAGLRLVSARWWTEQKEEINTEICFVDCSKVILFKDKKSTFNRV